LVFQRNKIAYHESLIWPPSFGKDHSSFSAGQNLKDIAQMARGTSCTKLQKEFF
jgi:hypothetical protein